MKVKMKKFCQKKHEQFDYYTEVCLEDILSHVTVLLGPNGTGKSMSLKHLEYQLKKNGIKCLRYKTSSDDIVSNIKMHEDNLGYKLSCAFHSEGERMIDSFNNWNIRLSNAIIEGYDSLYVLYDELDSGLSYDRIMSSLLGIMYVLKMELDKGKDINFIFTANSYEFVDIVRRLYKEASFIWVPTKDKINPKSYDEFISYYKEFYKYMEELDEGIA